MATFQPKHLNAVHKVKPRGVPKDFDKLEFATMLLTTLIK